MPPCTSATRCGANTVTTTALINCDIYTPSGALTDQCIVLRDGNIESISNQAPRDADRVFDLERYSVSPGFINLAASMNADGLAATPATIALLPAIQRRLGTTDCVVACHSPDHLSGLASIIETAALESESILGLHAPRTGLPPSVEAIESTTLANRSFVDLSVSDGADRRLPASPITLHSESRRALAGTPATYVYDCLTIDGERLTAIGGHDLSAALREMIQHEGVPKMDALAAVTTAPAKILGLQARYGRIAAGMPANLTVFDNEMYVLGTFVRGRFQPAWSQDDVATGHLPSRVAPTPSSS